MDSIFLDISDISVTMYLYLSFHVHIYRLNTFSAKTIFAAINIIHSSLFTGPAMLYANKYFSYNTFSVHCETSPVYLI